MTNDAEQIHSQEDSLRDLRFEGFKTPNEVLWKQWLQRVASASKLPLPGLEKIAYQRSDRFIDYVFPKAGYSPDTNAAVRRNPDGTSVMTLQQRLPTFSSGEKEQSQPKERIRSTFIHEIAHLNSPMDRMNDEKLSEEERAQAREEVELVHSIAVQSLITGKFLTDYHVELQAELITDYIAYGGFTQTQSSKFLKYREETWAILVQLRYTNPAQLRNVEEAQQRALKNKTLGARGYEMIKKKPVFFTPLLTPRGQDNPQGVDKILCRITGVESSSKLDSLVADTIQA